MDDKKYELNDNESEENEIHMKNMAKAGFYTFMLVLFVVYGLINLTSLVFGDDEFSILIGFLIVVIFLMIYLYLNLIYTIKKYGKLN